LEINKQREEIDYWQRASVLEEGRNQVLRMVASNEELQVILQTLCEKAQLYNPDMLCSVLRLDQEQQTLHPMASVSLPKFYCDALEGVAIGAGAGSCGTAAFTGKRVVVEDINTHPYWNQFKGLALEAGVQACWSEPIIGANGIVFGTFAMYYRQPATPSEEDLKFIELSGNLAAVVFENNSNRQKLLNANKLLSQTVDERNQQLERLNLALEKTLQRQQKDHFLNINAEKMLTTNSLISGLSHEISTPLGTALTAVTSAEDKLSTLDQEFMAAKLTRKSFINKITLLTEMIELNKQSLMQATDLLSRFKEVNASANTELVSTFYMQDFLHGLNSSIAEILAHHTLGFSGQNFKLCCAKVTLWQVLVNLIENSIVHGFATMDQGVIHINVVEKDSEIILSYQDDGCGLAKNQAEKIFEPFYSSNRSKKNIGLGLNIVNNLITHTLQGDIRLLKSPIGVRYEIKFPNADLRKSIN